MAHPTQRERRAQYTYARGPWKTQPPELPRILELISLPADVLAKIDAARSLDARLVLFYKAHSELRPCRLSAAELAIVFCPGAKHGERQVRRAHGRIRVTYGERFHERGRQIGRLRHADLATARWIETRQGGEAYSVVTPIDGVVASDHLKGRAVRARAREVASRSKPSRTRARPLDLPPLPAFLKSNEAAISAVRKRFGDDADEVIDDLQWSRYRARPVETSRALRTLVLRDPWHTPLVCFRGLYKKACGGDLLCDAADDAAKMRAAELDERMKDPDFAARAGSARSQKKPVPSALRARLQGLRDRLELLAPAHPHRAEVEAELASVEAQLAAREPVIDDDPIKLRESEVGPPSGRVVRIPGTTVAVVVHTRPRDPPGIPRIPLGEVLDEAACEALDRDEHTIRTAPE